MGNLLYIPDITEIQKQGPLSCRSKKNPSFTREWNEIQKNMYTTL